MWWVSVKTQSSDHSGYHFLSLSLHTLPKVKVLASSTLGNHGMALFVCICWRVLEGCVLSVFPDLIVESLWWCVSMIPLQNRVKMNTLAVGTVRGLLNMISFVLPVLTFTKEEVVPASQMFSFERMQHLGWKLSRNGVWTFPLLMFTCKILRTCLSVT